MSLERNDDGYVHYRDDTDSRAWFEAQWRIWPKRADERYTTNISFHYGGVRAFREFHGREPELSREFSSHVAWHDKHPHSEAEV